jgi:hypothetical protein
MRQSRVRALRVVVYPPTLKYRTRFFQREKPMLVQTLLTRPPIVGIIWRSKAAEGQLNAVLVRPSIQGFADELRALFT